MEAPVDSPSPLRLLLVDDASAARRELFLALESVRDVEVVGTASNVSSALTRVEQLAPDVIVTRRVLPAPDSSLLLALRQAGHTAAVVVFDAGLDPGAPATLDALLSGAAACVARPAGGPALAEAVRDKLLPAVRRSLATAQAPVAVHRVPPAPAAPPREAPPEVVAVAASTGGPDALAVVLGGLPSDFAVPLLIVQHMPSGFTTSLAERLSTLSRRRVAEARDGAPIDEADVWIAPGGLHLRAGRRADQRIVVRLASDAPVNSCRPSADVLFRSVADIFGARSLGVVLTGMGQDGLEGSRALCAAGARVLAQDQATSVVWSMPRFVAEARLADAVLPLADLSAEIVRRCRRRV